MLERILILVPPPIRNRAARICLNLKIKPYGAMTKLEIDTANKTVNLVLELKGETQPIRVIVSNYRLVDSGKCTFFELGEITASREWINALLAEPAVKEQIKRALAKPIPGFLKALL
jgi:hypothetical protein